MKYPRTRTSALKLGRRYYKTGKPCSRGHSDYRYAITGRCYTCDKINKLTRYKGIKERTPIWADLDSIKRIYEDSFSLGPDYHVDHVIPLHGKNVSGLHVHYNLEIKHKTENLKKGAKFNP